MVLWEKQSNNLGSEKVSDKFVTSLDKDGMAKFPSSYISYPNNSIVYNRLLTTFL